jgi:hypothetical protein
MDGRRLDGLPRDLEVIIRDVETLSMRLPR